MPTSFHDLANAHDWRSTFAVNRSSNTLLLAIKQRNNNKTVTDHLNINVGLKYELVIRKMASVLLKSRNLHANFEKSDNFSWNEICADFGALCFLLRNRS